MFQGGTVSKPNSLVVDVTSSHQPGMVYVMLSRVCSMQQLHIVDKFDPDKIIVNQSVRAEAARMDKVSVNNNPCDWMDPAKVGLRVCSLNCRSLRKHIEDVKTDAVLLHGDVIMHLMKTFFLPDKSTSDVFSKDFDVVSLNDSSTHSTSA